MKRSVSFPNNLFSQSSALQCQQKIKLAWSHIWQVPLLSEIWPNKLWWKKIMLLIFITCSISFSLSTIDSPLRFFIRFFSSFLQAYIFPVARVWQAHTSPKPPLPRTRYIRKVLEVTACRSSHFHWINQKYRHQHTLYFTFTFCCFPHGKPRNAFVS